MSFKIFFLWGEEKLTFLIKNNKVNVLPVTTLPLASVTGTATGVTVVTNCVTGLPLASKYITA